MFSKDELLSRPNYLLKKYQNEIYRQLTDYMQRNNLTQKDIGDKLGVSSSYISQVLNGNFNFTLKKLIELALMMEKVPAVEFVEFTEFWRREKEGYVTSPTVSVTINVTSSILVQQLGSIFIHDQDCSSEAVIANSLQNVGVSTIERCLN